MDFNFSKLASAAWGVFGKKAIGKAAVATADKVIDDLCNQYKVKPNCAKTLKREIEDLVNYMSNCILNGTDIDTNYVEKKINGPISEALLKAAYSSNDGQNFLSDIINRLDDSTIDDAEKFFMMAGSKNGADYIASFRNVLHDIREEVKESKGDNKDEMTITYEPKVKKTSQGEVSVKSARRTTPAKVHDGMSDDEDQQFVDNLTNDINTALVKVKARGGKVSPADMVDMTKLFIEKSADVAKFCEEQKTKRAQIRAQTQVAIHQIDTVRDFLKDYLQRSFDERRHIFDKEFEVVDKCLATGDTQALAITLNSITNLAQSSPFKALADLGSVRKTLENKGTFDI